MRNDHLGKRRDLVEAEHIVPIVVDDADGAIDLHARMIGLHDTEVSIEKALGVGSLMVRKWLAPDERREILPRIVAAQKTMMKSAQDQIGTSGSDLVVAIHPERRVCA